ncbi:MAG: S8 family serine peptidase [Rhodospirillaceae bacterium]|nr:S8 family serine peptidase [Rhodospirillaceae bacterium]
MPGQDHFYVVELKDEATYRKAEAAIGGLLKTVDGKALDWLSGTTYVLAKAAQADLQTRFRTTGAMLNEINLALRLSPPMTHASPERVGDLLAQRSGGSAPASRAVGAPTETDTPWHIHDIRIREAQAAVDASADKVPMEQIRLAHPDTGYSQHSVFGDWGADGSHPTIRGDLGKDFVDGGKPLDPIATDYAGFPGHGTRILSVIAGNNERLLGVAPGVTVLPYRVTKTVVIHVLGNDARLGEAIEDAIKQGCHVVNISLGDPCQAKRRLGRAVDRAYEAGVIIVAAAGNVVDRVTAPGRYDRTITAGGSTRAKRPWAGASRGPAVDVCAPADEIFRADWELIGHGQLRETYDDIGDGTSYATAHISGIACLWRAHWGARIEATYREGWQRVEAFRHLATATATKPPYWAGGGRDYGAGIIDALKVVTSPLPKPAILKKRERRAADQIFG